MAQTFDSSIVSCAFPELPNDVAEIRKIVYGPCQVLTTDSQLLLLRSVWLYKQYFAFSRNHEQFRDAYLTDRPILKLISIIHGLRGLNVFIHSVEGFFQLLERYQNYAPSFQFGQTLGFNQFTQQRTAYLAKAEKWDRIMSGLSKCAFARFLDYKIVADIEDYAMGHVKNEEDRAYIAELFQKAYGLYELNMLYNMQVHRIQPSEVVIAILFSLDVAQKDCVTELAEFFLKHYGSEIDTQFRLLGNIKVMETQPQ